MIPATGHSLTGTDAVAATCIAPGNSAYWTCETCGKCFSDAAGEHEIEAGSWVIAAKGHDYGAPTYSWSDDGHTCTATAVCKIEGCSAETTGHKISETVTYDASDAASKIKATVKESATTEKMGVTTYTATFANEKFTQQTMDVTDIPKVKAGDSGSGSGSGSGDSGSGSGSGSGDSESGDSGSGNSSATNPGTTNPGTENPGTTNPGATDPGTGTPGSGDAGTGNQETGNPDSGNQDADQPKAAATGTKLTVAKQKAEVIVTSKEGETPTVEYAVSTNTKSKTIKVPASVTIDGVKYAVTSVSAGAFKKCKKVETIVIPASVKKIKNNAFKGLKYLKAIKIKTTKLTKKTVASKAFKGVDKKVVIYVKKSKLSAYKKFFYKKGLSKKVKIKKL